MNIFEFGVRDRLGYANVCMKLDGLLNWESIRVASSNYTAVNKEDQWVGFMM